MNYVNREKTETFVPTATADGSFTFFSSEFQEAFHSHFGAKQEAEGKFVLPCQLAEKAKNTDYLRLLDVCYGLGYNSAAALATIWQINPQCTVELVALEVNAEVPKAATNNHLLADWPSPIPELLAQLATTQAVKTTKFLAKLLLADARQTIQKLIQEQFVADAIFLDPFSPPKCPQLWTVEFLALVSKCLKNDGRLATYSCAAAVRTALELAGLFIGSSARVGRRSPGTIASWGMVHLPPLSLQELEHLQTRAAIPYRDPWLNDRAKVILHRREQEQEKSYLEPTSQWKKRWLNSKTKLVKS